MLFPLCHHFSIRTFADFRLPRLTERGVYERFYVFPYPLSFSSSLYNLHPGERAVRCPDVKGHTVRRLNLFTGWRKPENAITGPDPGLFADITGISKVQILLADDAGIMLAEIKHAGGIIRRPFEAKRRLFVAKFKILLLPQCGQATWKRIKCGDSLAARSIWQVPLTLGVEPRMDFLARPSLQYVCRPERRRAFLFNILIKGSKFIITRHIHRLFTVVFAALPPGTRSHDHWWNASWWACYPGAFLPYHGASASSDGISRMVGSTWVFIKFSASPSVGNQIRVLRCLCSIKCRHKHPAAFWNKSDTGRLHHIHLAGCSRCPSHSWWPAERAVFPSALPVCGFFREIVIASAHSTAVCGSGLNSERSPARTKMPQPVNLTVRYIHSATPVSVHPARLLCSWLWWYPVSGNQHVGFPVPENAAAPTGDPAENTGNFTCDPRQHESTECGFHHFSGVSGIFQFLCVGLRTRKSMAFVLNSPLGWRSASLACRSSSTSRRSFSFSISASPFGIPSYDGGRVIKHLITLLPPPRRTGIPCSCQFWMVRILHRKCQPAAFCWLPLFIPRTKWERKRQRPKSPFSAPVVSFFQVF